VADKKTLHFIYNKYADKTVSSFENLNHLPGEISDSNSVGSRESEAAEIDQSNKVPPSHHRRCSSLTGTGLLLHGG
jgi:hypothetical protein